MKLYLPASVGGVGAYQQPVTDLDSAILGTLADAALDLPVATAADAWGRLAVGSAGQVLGINSAATALIWRNPRFFPKAINPQTNTTYTFAATDAGVLVTMNNAAAQTATIDTNANVAISTGTVIEVMQLGAGQVTIAPAGGVTLNGSGATLKIRAQHCKIMLEKIGTDTWQATGEFELYGGNILFAGSGNVSAGTLGTAIAELDTEKVAATSSGKFQFIDPYSTVTSTLTDQANAEAFYTQANGMIHLVDLTLFRQVRLLVRVGTGSASTNTPRLRVRYKTGAFSTTVGAFSDIGTSEVSCSLTTATTLASSWIDLAAGAKADVWVAVTQLGGDSGADPAISLVNVQYRD
jgi:hypothetical protein